MMRALQGQEILKDTCLDLWDAITHLQLQLMATGAAKEIKSDIFKIVTCWVFSVKYLPFNVQQKSKLAFTNKPCCYLHQGKYPEGFFSLLVF